MRIKKILGVVLCLIVVLSSLFVSGSAADIEKEREYKPLDLVVVIDSSGSMKESDKTRTALAAVRMLINMMPVEGSKVGVVGFNKTATVLTKDAKGNDALLSLESLTDIATIKKNVSDIVFNGGTGIGNAVFKATELLKANKTDERQQAVILFTDGVNDFDNDSLALSRCEENEASALLWAKKNNCPIYTVGYDYLKSDGTNSMGSNGEGLKKLKNISETTNGKFKSISSIKEIEQLLIEFLADVCDLNYTTVATIPGDGGKHECSINVSPSVVEANIRIAGGDENSIANGKIKLFDPDGNEIELRNSGNVRFDVDARAASIKVTMPKTGKWLLVVEGIKGEDIHVGLLEHFKMNLTSKITLPTGNPSGIAYSNDEIGIKTWLAYDGVDINDEAIYAAVKSAKAICVPRANPENKKEITLVRDGFSFVGSFIIPEDCFYDITIRLDWDTVYREDTLEVKSSNKPLYIVGDIPEIKVNKNKTVTVDDVYQYVADSENDKITGSVSSIGSADVADVTLNGDQLVVSGKKWSSTLATVAFEDAQGNVVETTFKIKVHDPVAVAMIIITILLLIVALILFSYFAKKASNKVKGKMRVVSIAEGIIDASGTYRNTKIVYSNPNIDHDTSVVNTVPGGLPNFNPGAGDPIFNPGGAGDVFNPMAGTSANSTPFGDVNPMAGTSANSTPFGDFNPMAGGSSASNSGSFAFPPASADTPAQASGNDVWGQFSDPMQGGTVIPREEEMRSNEFDERYFIGGSKVRNSDMATVVSLFVKFYSDFMATTIQNSKKVKSVKDFAEVNLIPTFARVHLLGTLYGKNGIVISVEKSIAKQVVFHSPKLIKNKAAVNPNNKRAMLSVSVLSGEKNSDGSVPCAHIEIEYSKQ